MADGEAAIKERFGLVGVQLNERQRRAFAAAEAKTFGHGGIAAAARACGLAENTVRKGLRELDEQPLAAGRVRKPGAGRPAAEDSDPKLLDVLRELVQDDTRGDPERVLLWTAKSVRNLADELAERGHPIGFRTVPKLLRSLGYSLQAPRKTLEGTQHPDRDAQFQAINQKVGAQIAAGQPAISIDTKKKELVGEFKNAGSEWHLEGQAPKVNTYDFPSMAEGKAIPYGIYDIAEDTGFVSVGIDRDTAQFSVAAITAWFDQLGRERYPDATSLLITADCGGSNGNRTRLWKTELQRLADRRAADQRLPLPARHIEMEQNRAPPVQLHLQELARPAAGLLRGDHQLDRRDHDQHRPRGLRPPRQQRLPQNRDHRPATRRRQHHPRPIPPRMELHHQPIT